jgi:hypothetical protein
MGDKTAQINRNTYVQQKENIENKYITVQREPESVQ